MVVSATKNPHSESEFDPASTSLTFRIGTPDFLAPPLMASLVSYLRMTAPRARLLLQPWGTTTTTTTTTKRRWPTASWML